MTEKDKNKLLAPYESYTKAIEKLFLKSPCRMIEDLRKVRNCITHADGMLEGRDDAKDIKNFAKKNKGIIDINKIDNSIILHKDFIKVISDEMINLINFLYNAVGEKIDLLATDKM